MSNPGPPGDRLPIFVKGDDGNWVPMRVSGETPPFFADAHRPVKEPRIRPTLCRFALAAVIACVLGPFTVGLLSVVSITLGLISLRRMRHSDAPVIGKRWALAAIALSGATLLLLLLIGPLGLYGTPGGCAAVFQPEFAGKAHARQEVLRVQAAARQWTGDCPTIAQLVSRQLLPREQSLLDPWGSPYRIRCAAGSIVVISPGPDRRCDTADDIVSD